MATVVFDYQTWLFHYPEFATSVPQGGGAALFAEAGLYLYPGDGSAVADEGQRLIILNAITAHLAALRQAAVNAAASGSSGLVGRVAGASEGSVSINMAPMTVPGSAEWWAQTPYGFTAWQMLAPYRTMRYVPGPGVRRPVYPAYGYRSGF
jgi:Protein of unknown function (DUF4054)